MAKDRQYKRSKEETRQRDLGNLLALVEYAKAEAMRLGAQTAPALLAAAMQDLEEALIESVEAEQRSQEGAVIRLADREDLRRKSRRKLIC